MSFGTPKSYYRIEFAKVLYERTSGQTFQGNGETERGKQKIQNPTITTFTTFTQITKYELCILYILQNKKLFIFIYLFQNFQKLQKLQNMNYGTYI